MSDINKRIHETAAKLAKVKAGLCEGCGLDSLYPNIVSCHTQDCDLHMECEKPCDTYTPCPACAKLQKIAKQCWHEAEYPHFLAGHFNQPCGIASKEASCKNGCGLKWDNGMKIGGTGGRSLEATFRNPTYTVQTMRTLLDGLGEYKGFIFDLNKKVMLALADCCAEEDGSYDADWVIGCSVFVIAKILQSDPDMRQAIDAYLEHRVGEVA